LAEEVLRFHLNTSPQKSRQSNQDRIIYIDPYADNHQIPIINPLELPRQITNDEEKEAMIDLLSQELARIFQEMITGTTLSLQMEALLVPCIAVLLRKGNSDLSELQRMMDDELNHDLVQLGQQSLHPRHQEFFKTAFQNNSTYRLTKQSIYTKLQSLLNSQIFYHLTTGKSTVNLEEAISSGKIVIFNLAQGKMGTEVSQLFGRLIIAMLQSIVLRRVYQPKTKRKPTFLFIDEAQNYLLATSIERMLAESRKYGLHLVLANQNIAQIESKKLKETLLSNTHVKFVGANSPTTLQKMAKEIGVKVKDFEGLKAYAFYLRI